MSRRKTARAFARPSAAARRRRRRSDDREPPPHRRPVRVAPVPVGPGAQRDLPPAATGERDARPPVDARPEEMEVVDARAVTDDEDMPAVLYATNDRPVCSLERNRGARSDRPVERPRVRSGRGQQREDGEYSKNGEKGAPLGHRSHRDWAGPPRRRRGPRPILPYLRSQDGRRRARRNMAVRSRASLAEWRRGCSPPKDGAVSARLRYIMRCGSRTNLALSADGPDGRSVS